MGFVHITRHVRAAPHDVFARVVDPDGLTEWLHLVEEVRAASPRLDELGAQLVAVMVLGPQHLEVDWVVTKLEPDRVLHLEGTAVEGGDAEVRIECGLWDGETEFELDLEYTLPGGFVTSVADHIWIERAIARDLKHSVRDLAILCRAPA